MTMPLVTTIMPPLYLEAAGNITELLLSTTMAPSAQSADNRMSMAMLKTIYAFVIPVMILILLLAVFGNGVIVASAHRLTSPVSPYLRLCVSLAAADMWAASLLISGLVVNSYLPVMFGISRKTMCFDAVLEIFRVSGMLTSDMHLFALAINQLIGTLWPLKYKMIVTSRRLRCLVFLLWLVPLLFSLAWFLYFPDDGLRHPKCVFHFYNRFPFRVTIFTVFMLPLFATLVIYSVILQHLLKAKAQFMASTANDGSNRLVPPRKNHVNSRLKLVWTTLLIVTTFSFSWGAVVCYFLIVCKEGCPMIYLKDISQTYGIIFNVSVNILVMFKLASNPFIYTLRIRAIHKSVESLFHSVGTALGRSERNHGRSGSTAPTSAKIANGKAYNYLSTTSFTCSKEEKEYHA